ncbi:MAG: MerC family mercury resistance protein [Vulcanimicrobiota bacterium]
MNAEQQQEQITLWDKLGMLASGACLIHCGLLPLLSLLPAFGAIHIEHDGIHSILLGLALPLAGLALIPAYRKHRRLEIALCGGLGLLFLACGLLLHTMEQPLTLAGAALLCFSHAANWRACRIQRGDCCEH